jgi:hypothetical protein
MRPHDPVVGRRFRSVSHGGARTVLQIIGARGSRVLYANDDTDTAGITYLGAWRKWCAHHAVTIDDAPLNPLDVWTRVSVAEKRRHGDFEPSFLEQNLSRDGLGLITTLWMLYVLAHPSQSETKP